MRTAYNSDKLADGILLQVQYSFLSGGAKSKVDSGQEEGVNVSKWQTGITTVPLSVHEVFSADKE